MVDCGQTSATWLPSTMPLPPSTRPSDARERRSSAFIRKDSGPLHRISQHITERTEAMHNMKKLILSVFIFTFGFATATHAQQVNTLLTKHLPEAPGKEIEVITVN